MVLKIFASVHLWDISLYLKRIRARHTEEKTTTNLEKEKDAPKSHLGAQNVEVTLTTGFGQGELNELADVAENREVDKELYWLLFKQLCQEEKR